MAFEADQVRVVGRCESGDFSRYYDRCGGPGIQMARCPVVPGRVKADRPAGGRLTRHDATATVLWAEALDRPILGP